MKGIPPDYVSYLLRLWKSCDGEKITWHGSLECTVDGKRWQFESITQLVAFLTSQFEQEIQEV